jgi:hypothetical protein
MRIFFTTKRLLLITTNNNHYICADATYKLIWQGYPVHIVGTTDRAKKFHPFGLLICINEKEEDFKFMFQSVKDAVKNVHNFDYHPTTLIANASSAITNGFKSVFDQVGSSVMCWAHLLRNVDK